jgi:hypothetical protein
MGSYGRNFDFRVVPLEAQRRGRIVLDQGTDVPVGAPLVIAPGATPNVSYTDALPATLATGGQVPVHGFAGIGVYEWIDYNQVDPLYITYSDRGDLIPDGKLCQLVAGLNIKVVFKNTSDRTFLNTRDYDGRIMVAGMGATPTVAIGDYLTPGVGDDTNGYWAVTQTANEGWLVVTNVDAARQEVEAEFNF